MSKMRKKSAPSRKTQNSSVNHKNILEQIIRTHDAFTKVFLEASVSMGLTTLDEGRFVAVSNAFLKLMGLASDEVIGRSSIEIGFITAEDRALFFQEMNKKGQIENYEMRFRIKNGEPRTGLFNATKISLDNKEYLLTIMSDITELKVSREALKISEQQHGRLFNNVSVGIFQVTPEGRVISANKTAARILGYESPQEMISAITDITHQVYANPEDRQEILARLKEDGFTDYYPMRVRQKNGNVIWVESLAYVVKDENGNILYHEGTMRDITTLKKYQNELRISEENYRRLFDEAPIGIYQVNPSGRFVTANKTVARILGYESPEDLINSVTDITSQVYVNPKDREKALEWLRKDGFFENFQLQNRQKNGNIIWVEASVYIVKDGNGNVLYHEGTTKDITKLIHAEEELKESNDKYYKLFNDAAVGMYQVTPQGQYITANFTAARQLGYETPEELIRSTSDIETQIYVNPADREEVIARLRRDGFVDNMEIQFRCKDGNIVWHLISAHVVKDEQGGILYHEGTCKDITELKNAQRLLRQSDSRYRQLYENMMDGFVLGDLNGNALDTNDAFLQMLGYSRQELLKLNYKEITPPPWHALDQQIIKEQILKRGYSDIFEKEYIGKGGEIIPVELRTTLLKDDDGKPSGFWAVVRNISQRKKAESQLRKSEEKYRQLHESIMDGYAQVDMEGYIIDCNESIQKMTGYSKEELFKLKYTDITPEKWHSLETYLTKNQLFSRGYTDIYEKEYRRKDGTIFPVELRTILLRDDKGSPVSTWAIIHDITERKQAQEKIKKSEEKYRKLHNSMMDGFSSIDMKGHFIECNESFLDMLGYSLGELREINFRKITPVKWYEFEDTVVREQLFTRGYTDVYEKEYIRQDGTVFPVELRAVLLRDEEGKPVSIWAIIRDITLRKREQERLEKSGEMYRLIAENVTDFTALVDKKGVIQHVSNSRDLLGYEPEELKNIDSTDLIYPEDADIVKSLFVEYAQKKLREIIYEVRIRHKEGRYLPMEIRMRSLTDTDGNFIGNVFGGRLIAKRGEVSDDALLSSIPHLKDRRLTEREKEILKWIMDGKSTWDIATILSISESTVKFHVDNIMKKFNAVNRAHAVAIYMQKQQIGIL